MTVADLDAALFRKVAVRLLPFLGLLYFFSILDRSNIDQCKPQMVPGLLSEWAYGFGAGIFYIGYCVLEVPSNLILRRVGARRWIARILVTWGLISAGMMFVGGAWSFIILRFMLGCAEAGFFPGILLYLTYWFPARQRARATALFMVAAPLVWMAGGPLTGILLRDLNGVLGLAGWQWVFLLEGLPSVVLGFVTLVYLTDRPESARWLTPDERSRLIERLASEAATDGSHRMSFAQAARDIRILQLIALATMNALGVSVLSFYFSSVLKDRFPSFDPLHIGLVKAACGTFALVAIVAVGASSDRTGERRLHIAAAAITAAIGFGVSMLGAVPIVSVLGLGLAFAATIAIWGPFWSLATSTLGEEASAGGIALINAIANLGAFVGPLLMSSALGFEIGLGVSAVLLLAAGILAIRS